MEVLREFCWSIEESFHHPHLFRINWYYMSVNVKHKSFKLFWDAGDFKFPLFAHTLFQQKPLSEICLRNRISSLLLFTIFFLYSLNMMAARWFNVDTFILEGKTQFCMFSTYMGFMDIKKKRLFPKYNFDTF